MQKPSLEDRMREREYFHGLRILPGAWAVVRVDGRGFTRFTAERFEKPFDPRFRDLMVGAARALLVELQGLYAYTESDEISLLLPPTWDLFDREVEKLVSLSAGIASSAFTHAAGAPAHFDSRIWLGTDTEAVIDYFRWRQEDAVRCALNGWCYWTLRRAGQSVRRATTALEGQSVAFKNELLFQHGINFNALPAWQRRGIALYWESYEKTGYNPKEGRAVTAVRRRVKVDADLPMKEEYAARIERILGGVGPAVESPVLQGTTLPKDT
jgi:tRNA(His) 5'-end guanylyltransferase